MCKELFLGLFYQIMADELLTHCFQSGIEAKLLFAKKRKKYVNKYTSAFNHFDKIPE